MASLNHLPSRWDAQITTASLPAAKASEPVPFAAHFVVTRWIIAMPPVWHTESCSRKLPGTTTMPQTQSRQDFESISYKNWALRWCLKAQRTRLTCESSSAGHRLINWEDFWNSTLSKKQFSLPRARHYVHWKLRTWEHAPSCIYKQISLLVLPKHLFLYPILHKSQLSEFPEAQEGQWGLSAPLRAVKLLQGSAPALGWSSIKTPITKGLKI